MTRKANNEQYEAAMKYAAKLNASDITFEANFKNAPRFNEVVYLRGKDCFAVYRGLETETTARVHVPSTRPAVFIAITVPSLSIDRIKETN